MLAIVTFANSCGAISCFANMATKSAAPTVAPRPTPPAIIDALSALADPTRVRILHLLRGGALCVGDLAAVLKVLQPKASRHLAYLQRARLIDGERRSGFMFYALAPARPGFHRKLLELLDAAAEEIPEAERDSAALRKLQTKGGCCPEHTTPRARR